MIRLKLLMEEVGLLPNGNLRITDINDISQSQWERINRIMIQKGYNMRGPDDCKRAVLKFLENPNNESPDVINHEIYDKWIETISMVLHLKSASKSKGTTYDCQRVIKSAIRQFGLTHDLNNAGYILPNGGLLNLSGNGHGRNLDHREIASVYIRLGIKVSPDEARSGTVYMQAFVNDCGAIRIGGSQNQCNVYSPPTRQQANQLITFFSMYDGHIHLDVKSKKFGADGQTYPKGTNPSRILRDIIRFYETGELPALPMHHGISFHETPPESLNEMRKVDLTRGGNDEKWILAFQGHLFIVDDTSELEKIQSILKKHPGIRDTDDGGGDTYQYLSRVAETAPDILVGEWYPDKKGLVIWNSEEIDPHTSLQAKKVARELGVKTVTFRYNDSIGNNDTEEKDISAKKLKGEVPKIMFHGTSTKELQSMLKYGLDPGRGRSRFGHVGIFHPDYIFIAATFEHAQFYADNAVEHDRSDKKGWDSFPIIIELELPDPLLLVPDYDADVTAGSKPYYKRIKKAPNPTAMKAMGVSREIGKWGYKGRIPASFFRQVYYYNSHQKKWHKSRPEVWQRLLDNYDLETISWKLGMQGYKEAPPKYGQFW